MLGDRGALAVVTLIFFVLAFVAALFVCLKHGFGRNGGWVFLMIFSIIRVAGSIAELVAVNDPSISSITAAAVLASSGFSTLLMAQIGFLQRLNEGIPSEKGRIPPIVFRVMILALIVALALGITGGVDQASSDVKDQNNGQTYTHAAGGLFAAAFGIMSIEALLTSRSIRHVISSDRKLLWAIFLAFPFLLVRLIYTEFVDFKVDPATFNTVNGSVIAQALMASLEEYIVVALFLSAGWFVPTLQRSQLQTGKYVDDAGRPREGQESYEIRPQYSGQRSGRVMRA